MNLLAAYLKEIQSTLAPKTVQLYTDRLNRFDKWIGERKVFDRKAVVGFLTYLRDMQYGKASIAFHKTAISAFYTWLVENEYSERNPVPDIPLGRYRSKHKPDDAAFTQAEYEQIKLVCATLRPRMKYWKGAVIIAWNTGLRLGDIACMEKSEIDMEGKRIRIVPNKTKRFEKSLEIPMSEELFAFLTEWMPTVEDRLFPRMCMAYAKSGAMLLCKQFSEITRKAGIEGKTFHCFRHHLTAKLLNAGTPLSVVSSITGNSIPVLARYSHVPHDARVKAMEAVL
jgi:integrase